MKLRNLIALAGGAALLNACIPSINPFYTEKDLVFDNRLVGEWQTKDSGEKPETWNFTRDGDKAYKLLVTDKDGKQGRFEAHVFQLKQEYFLDLRPDECQYATNQADLIAVCMFPGHLLARVPQFEPELKLAFFDTEWLEKYVKTNPQSLALHADDKARILTGETGDLQRFVLQHLGEGELFGKPGELIKRK